MKTTVQVPSFLEGLDEEILAPVVHKAEVVPATSDYIDQDQATHNRLRSIEDELLEASLTVVAETLAFRDIDPGATECPEEWIAQYGEKEAIKRFRMAQSGWLNSKSAPSGQALAAKMGIGIIKARATEKTGSRTLNITVVETTMESAKFPEIEVD